jgi:hypothetical protein
MPFRLGAIHVPAPPCVQRLSNRARLSFLPAPPRCDWFAKCPADGDMLGNDAVGDCDPVAKWRTIQVRVANAWGSAFKPTKDQAFSLYSILTGFDPNTLQPDNGTDTAAAMAYWATQGIRVDSQNLDVIHWNTVDPTDDHEVSAAIATTGPLQVTLALPAGAEDISTWSQPPGSDTSWAPGSWGTHRVLVGAYDGKERVCRTWGVDVHMHPEFWSRYVVAADASLSREWLNAMGVSPSHLDWDGLMADMAQLGS